MVNQVVYEFYALHHTQQLMREAQTSRTLNQMRTRKSKKDFRGFPLFARFKKPCTEEGSWPRDSINQEGWY
jgi:hypothetical protein